MPDILLAGVHKLLILIYAQWNTYVRPEVCISTQSLDNFTKGDVGCRFFMAEENFILQRVKKFKDAHPELDVHMDKTLPGVKIEGVFYKLKFY